MKPETLTIGGKKYAVIPLEEYERLADKADAEADVRLYDAAKAAEEEAFPAEFVNRLLDGKVNKLKIWREYRGLTQQQLADQAGLKKGYISQLETGRRTGTTRTLKKIADVLGADLEDVI